MKDGWNTIESSFDSGVLSEPLSFTHSSRYYQSNASLGSRGNGGFFWSLRSAGHGFSYALFFSDTVLASGYNDVPGHGFTVLT